MPFAAETEKKQAPIRPNGSVIYHHYRLTNATAEGLNSRIQAIKANARGFRSFQNFRIRILFFLGKLDLSPA